MRRAVRRLPSPLARLKWSLATQWSFQKTENKADLGQVYKNIIHQIKILLQDFKVSETCCS